MSAPIALREDYDAPVLRAFAKASKDANQTRRLLSLGLIYDGGRRSEAADLGGVTLQIVRDWVLRFNAQGPEGLIDRKAPGGRPKLNGEQRRALGHSGDHGSQDFALQNICALGCPKVTDCLPRGLIDLSPPLAPPRVGW